MMRIIGMFIVLILAGGCVSEEITPESAVPEESMQEEIAPDSSEAESIASQAVAEREPWLAGKDIETVHVEAMGCDGCWVVWLRYFDGDKSVEAQVTLQEMEPIDIYIEEDGTPVLTEAQCAEQDGKVAETCERMQEIGISGGKLCCV